MLKKIPENLFILEMANNHMGDITHGIKLIKSFGAICRKYPFQFAFKLQYRQLDSFIHPEMRGRTDVPYIKRFEETRLMREDFDTLVKTIRQENFFVISTPFDNESVPLIEEQELDIIKIASCSFGDWPLLERIAQADMPIIASTAGASLEVIDQVVSFFSHREKEFALMHCVGEYPTPDENLHLSQLDALKQRYSNVRIGFSTHEDTSNTDIIKMAIAKGVDLFEKHVALPTEEYGINAYSATPEQIDAWLSAAVYAEAVCGNSDVRPNNEKESASLRSLRRGVFLKHRIGAGSILSDGDVYFAFPPEEGQVTANEWSKYFKYTTSRTIEPDEAVTKQNCNMVDSREKIWEIVQKVRDFLAGTSVVIPGSAELEISHHYGLEKFTEYGLLLLTVVNRDYCKKILVSLPGQTHPEQYHKQKEETFHVLFGEIDIELDGKRQTCKPGDVITIEPGVRHSFSTQTGSVVEEISTTHFKDDSFYTDTDIMDNPNRKTMLRYWMS